MAIHALSLSRMAMSERESSISNHINELLKVILVGALCYVGYSVQSLNTTAASLSTDMVIIKDRLNKIDDQFVSRRELEDKMAQLRITIEELKSYHKHEVSTHSEGIQKRNP